MYAKALVQIHAGSVIASHFSLCEPLPAHLLDVCGRVPLVISTTLAPTFCPSSVVFPKVLGEGPNGELQFGLYFSS